MLVENMKMALTSLRANKMRSALTMLGIIIGIGSVISIVSIGDTMRKMFADIAKNVGVTQGAISIGYWLDDSEYRDTDYFSMEEMERIQELFSDRMVYTDSYASERGEARNNRKKLKLNFFGVKEKYWEVQPAILLAGRYLNEADLRERRENAVVNVETARKLFGSEHAVGQTFRSELGREIREFRVVGVYRQEVSPFQKLLSGNNDDSGEAYIPETLMRGADDTSYYMRYFWKLDASEEEILEYTNELKAFVSRTKNRRPEDWNIQTVQTQMKQVDGVMAGIAAAVGGIAAISLLVGGIGIMNIMLVSVTERTREIGIRKALGASTRDILIQFLTESALLSAMGGIIGILLSMLLVGLGGAIFRVAVVVKPSVIVLAVAFSATVGVFFGIYPAKKAAQEDPIVALRYE